MVILLRVLKIHCTDFATTPCNMLSDSDWSDSNDEKNQLLIINQTYAKSYKVRKEREELSKCEPHHLQITSALQD